MSSLQSVSLIVSWRDACYKESVADSKFTLRKQDHLRIALDESVQTPERLGLDQMELIHDSLPELNLEDVQIETSLLERPFRTPFYISGMTAGHEDAMELNLRLARAASERGWIFGVGSQRRELDADYLDSGIQSIVTTFSDLKLVANLGLAQLIELYLNRNSGATNPSQKKIEKIVQSSRASLIAVHLNPLQEAIQVEGTPQFKHGLAALQWLMDHTAVPVVVKETGSGLSRPALEKLSQLKLYAVDVSGLGGTHWGRVEGKRADPHSRAARMGETFKNWGISTLESAQLAIEIFKGTTTEVWASGGVRTGLDAAKLLALGCDRIGFAKPALVAALKSEHELQQWMATIEQELKVAMFCSGSANLNELNLGKIRGKS